MTSLSDRAYSVKLLEGPQLLIDDGPLTDWASENGVALPCAQIEALRAGIVPSRYLKNLQAINIAEQILVCRSKILVCGCGGLGGTLIQLLVRAGVGHLRLVDGDLFVQSNLNRQLFCDTRRLSHPKAQVAGEQVRIVNPFVEVEVFNEELERGNVETLIGGMDLVLDALDNIETRFLVAETARQLSIPLIHAAVAGWWGQISTFLPGSAIDLGAVYGKRRSRHPSEDTVGVLGATAAVIASLEALEALRILCGRKSVYAEQLLYFDGETGRTEVVPLQPPDATR